MGFSLYKSLSSRRNRFRSDTQFTGDDLRKIDPKFQPPSYARYLATVQQLGLFAQENYGKRVIHLALRWVLDQPGVAAALWGARRPDLLAPIDEATGWSLDSGAITERDRIVRESAVDLIGPEFMVRSSRGELGAP